MAKYPARVIMGTAKPAAPKATAPKPAAPKPVVKAAPKIDMSTKAVLGRAERAQREEARESRMSPSRPGVTRTTVNERPTPTTKGKR